MCEKLLPIPPGETIKEQLEMRNMTQKEFSLRMGMSQKHISRLINGEVRLTTDVAEKLELVLGVPARFWNNLEAIYRERLTKDNIEKELEVSEEMKQISKFPYAEMAKYGWVPKTNKKNERIMNLRRFFEVVNLDKIQDFPIACRKLSDSEKSDYALLAFSQKARIEARNVETKPIDIKKISDSLNLIRKMTMLEPDEFKDELCDMLAKCGVALIFLPHLEGSYLHGATFIDDKKIVVGITLRGKDADKFWFSLFHELGHILYEHIFGKRMITEYDEREADEFAMNTLINKDLFDKFVLNYNFSRNAVVNFANYIGVAPGIVVGRLQKEKYINYSQLNDLKTQYSI